MKSITWIQDQQDDKESTSSHWRSDNSDYQISVNEEEGSYTLFKGLVWMDVFPSLDEAKEAAELLECDNA